MSLILWNKKYGETLACTLERFKVENPLYKNEKITYAGRLDPMAEGLVLLLTGSDVYKKDDFLSCDKKYRMQFILGVETDSLDVLGLVQKGDENDQFFSKEEIKKNIKNMSGRFSQKYPSYSSKKVSGKPLYKWAKEGGLGKITIPEKECEIFSLDILSVSNISKKDLHENIKNSISLVEGDFRQELILEAWKNYFEKTQRKKFQIIEISAHVSSGTYMRVLAQNISRQLNSCACSIKITRDSIDEYNLVD